MPSPKSEERIKAEQMYHDKGGSVKLVDIAAHLGVPAAKVRKWKSLDNWDGKKSSGSARPTKSSKKKQVERSTSKGSAPQEGTPAKKRGAPLGNKNAVGNKGGKPNLQPGNTLAETHGIYSRPNPYSDILSEHDLKLFNGMVAVLTDEESILNEQIAILTIRERWLLDKIQQIQNFGNVSRGLMIDQVIRGETLREFANDAEKELYQQRITEKVEADKRLPGHTYSVNTITRDSTDLLLRAHAELSRVQSEKRKCIESLNRLKQSQSESTQNIIAVEWIQSLIGAGDE